MLRKTAKRFWLGSADFRRLRPIGQLTQVAYGPNHPLRRKLDVRRCVEAAQAESQATPRVAFTETEREEHMAAYKRGGPAGRPAE